MKTILLTYLALGILSNVLGPLANKMKKNFEVERENYSLSFELLLRFSTVVFYPFFYAVLAYDYFHANNENKTLINVYSNNLYFKKMKGTGHVKCYDCGFTQRLVAFMHASTNGNDTINRGHQCQKCGMFKEIIQEKKLSDAKTSKKTTNTLEMEGCECGGTLERELPLFCPTCKSNNLDYECLFMT